MSLIKSVVEELDAQLSMAEEIKTDIEDRLSRAQKPKPIKVKKKLKKFDICAVIIMGVTLMAIGALVLTYFLMDNAERNILWELLCVGGVGLVIELIIGIIRYSCYRKATVANRTALAAYNDYVSAQQALLDGQLERIGGFTARRDELVDECGRIDAEGGELIKQHALKSKECQSLKAELARLYEDCISAPDYRHIDFVDFLAGLLRSDLVDSLRDAILFYEKKNKYNELMAKLDALLSGQLEEE